MGLVKISGLLSNLGGKFSGSVIQGGKSGLIMRNNNWQAPKQFPKWQAQKASFAVLSQTWRTLTQVQRDAWAAIVASYPATNRFGDSYDPSGFQLYMTLNGTLEAAGQTLLLVPLPPAAVHDVGAVTLDLDGALTLQVTITNVLGANDGIQITASRPQSQGRAFRDGSLSSMIFSSLPATTIFNIETEYLAQWGDYPSGSRIIARVESIREDTGQSGNPQFGIFDVP